jgi:phosphohistidine phosphatase SixA
MIFNSLVIHISKGYSPDLSATNLSPSSEGVSLAKGGLFLLVLILLAFSYQPAAAQETTTLILVRHAEKADDGTDDPPLNETGKERATALANHLKETDITAIYSTNYKRTIQTVRQIADAHGLEIKLYNPSEASALNQILDQEAGGTVLISGHSNTTPKLVNKLIGEEKYEQFKDSDYNNLFIVMADEVGKGTVVKLTF